VDVLPDGTLSKAPVTKQVANLPHAALLNGIAFARAGSEQLLVADSFRGLIWNVNVNNGTVGVALNDTTTKGPSANGPAITGVNGVKIYGSKMYWTNTGRSSFYSISIDKRGNPSSGATPTLIAANITAGVDDFVLDREGVAYICGPYNAITKVTPTGQAEIVAGTFNSTASTLGGPTAVRFGKLVSDRYSLYVTTNDGILTPIAGSSGVSRIDLGHN
jgi:sugar lactone lactonase YvrE